MLSSELRSQVLQYVDSNITLEQLEDWYVPRLPILLRDPDSADADVTAAIELALAEISNGLRTEEEARWFLYEVVNEHRTILVDS